MESIVQEKELTFEDLNTVDVVFEKSNSERSEVCVSACCHKDEV